MTIMEKNAIWFIVFLEIRWDKFFRMENVSVQKEGECFCVVCSVGNYGIVNKCYNGFMDSYIR